MHIYKTTQSRYKSAATANSSMQLWDDLIREGEPLVKYIHLLPNVAQSLSLSRFIARFCCQITSRTRDVTKAAMSANYAPGFRSVLLVSSTSRPQRRIDKNWLTEKSWIADWKTNSPQSSRSPNLVVFVKGIPLAPYFEPVKSQILDEIQKSSSFQAGRRATW